MRTRKQWNYRYPPFLKYEHSISKWVSWAENFRIVYIEINDCSPLFTNLKIKSIQKKCKNKYIIKFIESETANQKPVNNKFYAPFNQTTRIGRTPVEISEKREESGISRNQKCRHRVDIQTKRSVIKVSNSKVFSSGYFKNLYTTRIYSSILSVNIFSLFTL